MAIQKIAVLGGGMGSLTSVFQLTSDPSWQTKYDITVYQKELKNTGFIYGLVFMTMLST